MSSTIKQLEEFARRLENFNFEGRRLKKVVPVPVSVQLYLEQLELKLQSKNNPNQVMEKLKCESSSYSQENYYAEYISFDDMEKGLANNELHEGIIHIHQEFWSNAYVALPDKSKDVLISSIQLRNRALNGDKVVVKILDKSKWLSPDTEDCQRTGEVVYITKKNDENLIFVGHIALTKRGVSELIPEDKLLPKLRINISNWPFPIKFRGGNKKSRKIWYAVLKNWEIFKYPEGELIPAEIDLLSEHKIQEEPCPENINTHFSSLFSIEEEQKQKKY